MASRVRVFAASRWFSQRNFVTAGAPQILHLPLRTIFICHRRCLVILPPRLPGFAFKQRWFLHQRINSYNVVTWPLTAGSHWRCFWIGGRRRNLHSFFIRLGARDFYCRDCRVDLFDRQSEPDQHCSRDPDNSDQSCGMAPFHTETMATPAMAMTPSLIIYTGIE